MSYDPKRKHKRKGSAIAKRAMNYMVKHKTTLKQAWAAVKRHDPKRAGTGPRGGKYYASTKKGTKHKKRYDHMGKKRKNDPARRSFGMGRTLGKIVSAALTTIGGNVGGDLIGPVLNAKLPMTVQISNSHALNVPTEAAGFGSALLGEFVKGKGQMGGLADDFLKGMGGGLAAVADPIAGTGGNSQDVGSSAYGIGGQSGVLG